MNGEHGWTHPICACCYETEQPGRRPVRAPDLEARTERCCWCGARGEGIYYRADPKGVPYCPDNEVP